MARHFSTRTVKSPLSLAAHRELGAAIVQRLTEAGAEVHSADLSEPAGDTPNTHRTDVSVESDVQALIAAVVARDRDGWISW